MRRSRIHSGQTIERLFSETLIQRVYTWRNVKFRADSTPSFQRERNLLESFSRWLERYSHLPQTISPTEFQGTAPTYLLKSTPVTDHNPTL